MISGLSCTFESSCTCIGLGAGKLIPESDLTEKLLTNDFPEDKLVMEPDRIDTSMLFKEALKVDLISLSIFFCLLKNKFLESCIVFFLLWAFCTVMAIRVVEFSSGGYKISK